jgi:hypothetical protein
LSASNLEAIAQEWALRLGLTVESVRLYLTQNIHYYLDPPCLDGLDLYYHLGAEIGALPSAPELCFIDDRILGASSKTPAMPISSPVGEN